MTIAPDWAEYLAWAEVTGRIVDPPEYAILRDMHKAWREAMTVELANNKAMLDAEADNGKPPAPPPKRGKRR